MARTFANTQKDPETSTLAQLCNSVSSYAYPYEDVAELVEDRAYAECARGRGRRVVQVLGRLAVFFEQMKSKSEENTRDLADLYLLTGEICQFSDWPEESISWFEKAIVVDCEYDVSYHSLATSCLELGNIGKAVQSLQQEIRVAPGNYHTYLLLADLYREQHEYEMLERILESLLQRDPDNIQALHKLIDYYEKRSPVVEVELLRRRLIAAHKKLVKLDLVIWTYHMCEEKKYDDALRFLAKRETESPGISITHLLKAHILGQLQLFKKKRHELIEFRRLNHGREEFMRTKLDEFAKVFGEKARSRVQKKLAIARLTAR